jgi:hypothetical protein
LTALFGSAKLLLDETSKAITPFGGLASFVTFLGQIGYAQQLQRWLPFAAPASNNAIPLAHTLTAFIVAVVAGGRRFAHCQWLRADHALHALLGLERFPGDDTIQEVKVTGKPVSVALNRIYFTNALRFGLNELVVEDPLSPVVFSNGGKKLIIMPVNLDGPARVQVSPQPQPISGAIPPTAQQNQPPAETGAQTERTDMPRTARTTIPVTTPTSSAETLPANNNNGNGNGNGSAVKSLVEHVEQIKENLKNVIRDLNGVLDTVKLADKEKKATDKEIEAVRIKLRQIQNVTI